MEALTWKPVRTPTPAERRTIVRHFRKLYNNVIVAGIYDFPSNSNEADLARVETYIPALTECLKQYPFLSVVLKKNNKNDDVYARASHVDLRQHFNLLEVSEDVVRSNLERASEDALLARVFEGLCNDSKLTFFDTVDTLPGWRTDVLPLRHSAASNRVFISFTYAHYLADGMSGVAFHKTLLQGLDRSLRAETTSSSTIFETSESQLVGLPHLPISLKYLLAPALGLYLPSFLSRALGLKPIVSGADSGTWTGTKMFVGEAGSVPPVKTAVEVLSIHNGTLTSILAACRKHDAKLTSLLNELIARCMSRHLPMSYPHFAEKTNLISATSFNLRKAAGISDNVMGVFASASYTQYDIDHKSGERDNITIDDQFWAPVSKASHDMAKDTSTLNDTPTGLLNWVSNFDSWMEGQVGEARDASWQMSNLMSFDGKPKDGEGIVEVEKMFFCQPGHAVGEPLDFNTISTKGGDLVICSGWQIGAIGVEWDANTSAEAAERDLVRNVLRDLKRYLQVLAEER
ncbi:Alcohol acetyltransferase [Knufia obscura]|uniref:Alcohol acetyltransferase n=1 Tax=Knufia obscura TaxID=1635080 RepID=A0ABR0R981_9EURO|nr:Alcohol acetyltransferase [Knufia obscura]